MHKLRDAAAPLTVAALVLLNAGCASYVANRARDAADIFTLTIGVGAGARVQVGPVHVAVIQSSDLAGLRGGEFFSNGNGMMYNEDKMAFVPIPRSEDWNLHRKEVDAREKALAQAEGREWKRKKTYWEPNLFGSSIFVQDKEYACSRRGKDTVINCPGPFWASGQPPSYFTQLEVSGGLLGCVRAGFNPGELLDFILGWTTLDIYGDDEFR
jgi:hypothetical protein